MDYGLVLPTLRAGATVEGIESAAEAAERHGFTTVWTTDHVLVPHAAADEYGRIFDVIVTLAHVGARHPGLKLGTSVIVVPMRGAVVLAKELASLDALTGGRVIAGVGIGWNEAEFANVGEADRFHVRGAYLDETIALWRHLWSGSEEPFHGRFHDLTDFVFGPLPAQGAALPIVVGGRSDAALRRAGRLGDAYQPTSSSPATAAERLAVVRAEADAAGRPQPSMSARVRVERGTAMGTGEGYALRGTPDEIRTELDAWRDAGAEHLALAFGSVEPEAVARDVEWWAAEFGVSR